MESIVKTPKWFKSLENIFYPIGKLITNALKHKKPLTVITIGLGEVITT